MVEKSIDLDYFPVILANTFVYYAKLKLIKFGAKCCKTMFCPMYASGWASWQQYW
ncbi:hypothetical protein [Haemophilus paraphrohaemolyticus]|uniref:hypothetical protein n=1 Tax=Haemophilus paraphrohaemolyticus TaxID=736 RepID=UPI001788C3D7|nr:hypothetical protein [Haemophilus paraphrohaemolyticus]